MTGLLRSLKRPVEIEAYVTRGNPTLDSFVDVLGAKLEAYKAAAPQALDYSIVDTKDEVAKKRARAAGLVEQPSFMGLVIRYGDQESVYKSLSPDLTSNLPFLIGGGIHEVRDKVDGVRHRIGVLTGHDEIRLTEANLTPLAMGEFSIQSLIEKNVPDYVFQDVDLKGGEAAITDDLEGLIITQPSVDLTERELRRIDEFVMKGRALAVFASAVNVKAGDARMNASLSTHGLEKLLGGYGISIDRDVVLDPLRPVRVVVQVASGQASISLPQILHVEEDSSVSPHEQRIEKSFPAFFRVDGIAVPFASSLAVQPDRQPKARVHVLMRSSPNAAHLSSDSVDLAPFQRWARQLTSLPEQQFAIAAEVGGTLVSAFPQGDGRGVEPLQSAKVARVFVMSSSQFLTNPLARAGNPDDESLMLIAGPYAQTYVTQTILVFKQTLDWLTMDADLLTCSGMF